MIRKFIQPSAFACGAAIVALSVGSATSADDKKPEKVPAIKEIMSAAHKGDDAAMAKLTLAVKDGKWDDAQKFAKLLADNGSHLGKNAPKLGEADSWKKLAGKYAVNTKALADATGKQDADATKAALETLGASCKECHAAHRPMKKKKN